MIPLRDRIPQRRTNPTKNPTGTNWSEHKPDLKEDFNSHCAYCYSYDGFRHTYYEVDHFIPKDFFKPLGNIGLCQYNNLVYSCKFCNNSKRAKWPTQSESIYNDGLKGFIDPCLEEYDSHFYRTSEGAIMWKTELGKWMHNIAFKLDERERSIIVLWNMERLRNIIKQIVIELNKREKDNEEYLVIKNKLGELAIEYFYYHDELIDFYDK